MISLAVDYKTEQEVREAFEQLKQGGEVLMELAPQFSARCTAGCSTDSE